VTNFISKPPGCCVETKTFVSNGSNKMLTYANSKYFIYIKLKKYITNNSLMIAAGAISQNECH
jgi:hypothetical protein